MTPKELIGTQVQAKGGKGGRTDVGRSSGSRHTARGAETSGGGWWVVGGGEVQMENDTFRERMWVAGERER